MAVEDATGRAGADSCVSETDCNLDSNSTVTVTLTETVTLVVSLPMTLVEFVDAKQQAFKEAVAKTAGHGVRVDHVVIDTIEEMSTAVRRLLAQGIRISVSVKATDKDAAAAIATSLIEAGINAELQKDDFPPVTVLKPAFVKTDLPPEEIIGVKGTGQETTLLMGPVATVGGIFAVSIVFAGVTACQGLATNQRQRSPIIILARLVGYSFRLGIMDRDLS